MPDHDRYEELATLAAGELLSEQERGEWHEHAKTCVKCLEAEKDFSTLLGSGLPLTETPLHELLRRATIRTDEGTRARFLARARREGITFLAGRRTSSFVASRAIWHRIDSESGNGSNHLGCVLWRQTLSTGCIPWFRTASAGRGSPATELRAKWKFGSTETDAGSTATRDPKSPRPAGNR